jgi:hypothetical protein
VSIVEVGDLIRLHGQVGDDEAHGEKQLARMPFNLGDHTALLVPKYGLILELLAKPLHLGP